MPHRAPTAPFAALIWLALLFASAAKAQTFIGSNLGPIPDGTAAAPLSYGPPRDIKFTVSTPILGTVWTVTVDFNVSHTWVGDLKVQLIPQMVVRTC